jgi:predicted RNA methylase
LHDQIVELYRTMIKTLAWQPRIFTQVLYSSVVNANVLYMSYFNLEKSDDGYTFLSFVTLLIKEICGVDSKKK